MMAEDFAREGSTFRKWLESAGTHPERIDDIWASFLEDVVLIAEQHMEVVAHHSGWVPDSEAAEWSALLESKTS